ncbi:MAG: carboxypeptidase regulatory-like domain-containing protein [Armatimonadia bacterium]
MQTRQTGPDLDRDLTPTAVATYEKQPNASPGATQNRIVFVSNGVDAVNNTTANDTADGQIDATAPANANDDLWIMRSDGSEQYKLLSMAGDQVDPSYDPGGRLVAFSSQVNGIWQIFTVEVRDPSIVRQITFGAGDKLHATWSPDSNWIAFQCNLNGTWDIYKVASSGAQLIQPITSGVADDTDPAWSPSGGVLAFTRDAGGVQRIFICAPDGTEIEQISNGGGDATADDKEPAFRPDPTDPQDAKYGYAIAFASTRAADAGDTSGDWNILRMPGEGEVSSPLQTLPVSTESSNDTDPSFTLNMTGAPYRIVFTSDRSGLTDIWMTQQSDVTPPILAKFKNGTLTSELPSASPRLASPGGEVTVSVPVYDGDSGVYSVMALFKDPEISPRIYDVESGHYYDSSFQGGERWLEIDSQTVGRIPLQYDATAGEYVGTWQTPTVNGGHDYIIDIMVVDKVGNYVTYDDVYGFSTRTFSPRNNVLFVDDYCEGQSYLYALGQGYNNDYAAGWHVETYYTYNPSTYGGVESTIDYDTIQGGVGGSQNLSAARMYDVWRVICRGAIPQTVYQYYLPTIEYQLDPARATNPDAVATRAVPVADRAVIWAAPHTGNVWIADGTIMDASVQADVGNFVRQGGRLFMSGEDIVWALTLNGTQSNSFVTNILQVSFLADCAVGPNGTNPFNMERTAQEFGVGGLGNDPVSDDAWNVPGVAGGGSHAGDWPNWTASDDSPLPLKSARVTRPSSPWYTDAAQWSIRPDSLTPLGSTKIYGAAADEGTAFGPCVGVRYEYTGNTLGGKVVFLSFGLEQIHRGYDVTPSRCRNHRSHLIHNFACWSRTGGFQGTVLSVSDAGQAVNDPTPVVRVSVTTTAGTDVVKYAVRCQEDGTYIVQGLPPGRYNIDVVRPGYTAIDHYEGEFVHGGQLPRTVDFTIEKEKPGAIAGTVTSRTSKEPLSRVAVSIVPDPDMDNPPSQDELPTTVYTGADGRYMLPNIPPGEYLVTANGAEISYGSKQSKAVVRVGDTTTLDFRLDAANGSVNVKVVTATDGKAVVNARVSAVDSAGTTVTAYTDQNGDATLNLPPRQYSLTAGAAGYSVSTPRSVTVEPATTLNVDPPIALETAPPGKVAGRVVSAGTGAFIGGVTVRLMFGDRLVGQTTTSSTVVTEDENGIEQNFLVDNVPSGELTVVAEKIGMTAQPTSQQATVESGATTYNVNFTMDALHTFPKGLQLVSFPWDYSDVDPATMLGVSSSSLRMATWETTRQRYRLYPEAPADRFRLGTGYWMNLTASADLSVEGVASTDTVEIPLSAGWNLVGCPHQSRIDFYTGSVRSGTSVYTLQEALSRGMLGSGLYAYVLGGYQTVGVLSPYTGYWLKANQPCYLILTESVGGLAAGQERSYAPSVENGWLLQLKTAVAGTADTATYLGAATGATEGCDFNLDQAKPPVPAMGAYVYTAIDNSGWSNSAGNYGVDVRPTGQKNTWKLKVYTNQVGQKVRVGWPDLSQLPKDVRPLLVDTKTGQQVYMRTNSSYVFTASDTERELQVVVTPQGLGQLAISPMAASTNGSAISVSYVLSRPAQVTSVICNIAGRTIRQLADSEHQAAGQNTLLWDGRDARGNTAPNGRYLVTIIGRTDSGQEARAVMPLYKGAR